MITTTAELTSFCQHLAKASYLTIDTEFMRERTYWSKLCLIQLAGPDSAAAVDPLAEGLDLTPLYELLANPAVLKVFHAARQDIEIFFQATGHVPAPIFDTQVAAMVCGYGEAASYETLCNKLAGVQIDKSSRFTDWSQRPLTDRQIDYAMADVTHLRVIYEKLAAQLAKSGRTDWVAEEMAILTNPKTYQVDPMEVWRRLKFRSDKPRLLAALRELAAWREHEAQRLNIPRARVMKDEALMEIAAHMPDTPHELARTRGLQPGFADSKPGAAVMAALAKVRAMNPADYPASEARRHLPSGSSAVIDLLKVLLRQVSDDHGIAAKLIATSDDLEEIAVNDAADVMALKGWRRELFGDLALALKRGELGLAIRGKKTVLVDLRMNGEAKAD